MTSDIDFQATLAGWWEQADPNGPVHEGDLIIFKGENDEYIVETETISYQKLPSDTRILYRATPPKPAWHDAVAVIAHTDSGHIRQVWERDGDTDYWVGTEGYVVPANDLIDPVPLIEARVDDEMVQRARSESNLWEPGGFPDNILRAILTAALGIGDDK